METVNVIVSLPQLYVTDAHGNTRAFFKGERVTLKADEAEPLEAQGHVYRHFESRPPSFAPKAIQHYETKVTGPAANKSEAELANALRNRK